MDSQKLQLAFFIVLFIGIAIVGFLVFLPFLNVLVLAAVLAVVLQPFYLSVKKSFNGREALSALIVVIISAICVLVPLIIIGSNVFEESRDLYLRLSPGDANYLDIIVQNIEEPLSRWFPNLVIDIRSYVDQLVVWIGSYAGALLTGTALTALHLFLGMIAFYYFLKDGPKFKRTIVELSPLKDEFDRHIFDRLQVSINTVIKGTLLIALLQGILAGIGMAIFGIPNATLWGLLAVVGAVIPGLGTGLVIIPAVIYLLIIGATGKAIALTLWGLIMVGLIDNILAPYLYSKGTDLHPLIILFSVLGGIIFFGPIGFIFGPLIITLLFVLLKVYKVLILKTASEETLNS